VVPCYRSDKLLYLLNLQLLLEFHSMISLEEEMLCFVIEIWSETKINTPEELLTFWVCYKYKPTQVTLLMSVLRFYAPELASPRLCLYVIDFQYGFFAYKALLQWQIHSHAVSLEKGCLVCWTFFFVIISACVQFVHCTTELIFFLGLSEFSVDMCSTCSRN
jgi:hypothetical protein